MLRVLDPPHNTREENKSSENVLDEKEQGEQIRATTVGVTTVMAKAGDLRALGRKGGEQAKKEQDEGEAQMRVRRKCERQEEEKVEERDISHNDKHLVAAANSHRAAATLA